MEGDSASINEAKGGLRDCSLLQENYIFTNKNATWKSLKITPKMRKHSSSKSSILIGTMAPLSAGINKTKCTRLVCANLQNIRHSTMQLRHRELTRKIFRKFVKLPCPCQDDSCILMSVETTFFLGRHTLRSCFFTWGSSRSNIEVRTVGVVRLLP